MSKTAEMTLDDIIERSKMHERDAIFLRELVGELTTLRVFASAAVAPRQQAPSATAKVPEGTTTTDAIIKQFRGKSERGLVIALADHARCLEADVRHWQRMYECAQNANAYRQDALDERPAAPTGNEEGK